MLLMKEAMNMKKILPLALLGAAIGAAGYVFNRQNKSHVEKTITALDDIGESAEETVRDLAKEISEILEY